MIKRVGVLTSGGDAPGMNAAIRSVVRSCLHEGVTPFGVEAGYKGLIEGRFVELKSRDVANTIHRGGTFLRSARSEEFKTADGQKVAVDSLSKFNIDALIVIGGDGSLTGANALYKEYGVPVIGIPATIDNDIYGTELSIGVDTALGTIVHYVDIISDTASSHDRTFIVEVMGRKCGYLALTAAITTGAEAVLIPEVPYDISAIIAMIKKRYEDGKTRSIIITAEGAISAYDLSKQISLAQEEFDTRISVLGYVQRGGSPTHFDRLLASRLGNAAVKELLGGAFGVMVGLQNKGIVPISLDTVLSSKKELPLHLLALSKIL